jgi:hypothetical protein
MVGSNEAVFAFNRGLVSPLALSRIDLKRMALSAEVQTNWMPRVLGSMMLRPGTAYLGATNGNGIAKFIPFIFSTGDVALIEATDSTLRFWVGEQPVTRVAVGTTIVNGTFPSDLSSWTSADESGAVSSWVGAGTMQLVGTGFNAAKRWQQVTVAPQDQGVEHAVRIVITQESVRVRIGTSFGDDSYVNERVLRTGTHSLAFTPTANFVVQLSNNVNVNAWVHSIAIEGPGVLTLPSPWPVSVLRPNMLRWDQSGDVVYVACDGFQPRKIKRTLGASQKHSWSIELFAPQDGPFLVENTGPITLTPSATTGAITLMASEPLFYSGHVGALFRIASIGQHAAVAAAGTNQFSAAIKVTGIGADRNLAITISGTFSATVVLQRSVGAIGAWQDVPGESWTTATTTTYLDGLDNQVIFYRIGIESSYTSGTANAALDITTGSITGVCRITAVNSATSASANVMTQPGDTGVLAGLGSITASSNWWEGKWSGHQGFPTAVALYEGRLWFAGRDTIDSSISDAFESFDDTQEGDSGPIDRTIGSGPVDVINWLLPLQRLVIGGQGAEKSARSSSFDSPLTPTDFILKDASTQGSASIQAVKIDFNGVFVQRSGLRVYLLAYSPNFFAMDYSAKDLTNFVPDLALTEEGVLLASVGIATIAVQRQPDTRIHAVLNDGTVRVLILEESQDEQCWVKVATSGVVEDVVVLPGTIEDLVYYVARRTVNGAIVRYLERWAREDECYGGAISKCADAHIAGTNALPSATISGLSHLVGQQVVCWADGIDQGGPYTVSASGTIMLPSVVTNYVVGLGYTAQFKSTKLAYAAQLGTALTQRKRVVRIGFNLANAHYQGLQYGPDFARLDGLPLVVGGVATPANTVWAELDDDADVFPAVWDPDSRICLQAVAPRPITVTAAVVTLDLDERA